MTFCNDLDSDVQRIRQEIERLTREQMESLRRATYVGMTAAEATAHDERRKKITGLTEQLRLLQQTK